MKTGYFWVASMGTNREIVLGVTNYFPFVRLYIVDINLSWLLAVWCVMTILLISLVLFLAFKTIEYRYL